MATDNTEWQPFKFLDMYIKETPDNIACDYREVTHKIPPLHTMIDPRTNQERKGIFIPEGDIQAEIWFNPVDTKSSDYEDWHKSSMHFTLMEVDKYNRDYCDNQKRKRQEEGRSPIYIGNSESIGKRKIVKEFGGRDNSPMVAPANRDGGQEAKNESYNYTASKPLQKAAVTLEDDYGDIDL